MKIELMTLANCLIKVPNRASADYYFGDKRFKACGDYVGMIPVTVYYEQERQVEFWGWVSTEDDVR